MSWSITASGHSPDSICEGWLLDRLADLLSGPEAGLVDLHITTEHFGEFGMDVLPHARNGNGAQPVGGP